MFFLKQADKGYKRNNIIYIENFVDQVEKIKILKDKLNIKTFKSLNNKLTTNKDIKFCEKLNKKFLKYVRNFYVNEHKKKIDLKIINLAIGLWSYQYISSFFYKYKLLKEIKKKYPKLAVLYYSQNRDSELRKERNSSFETVYSYSSFFNNKIFSDIAKHINVNLIKADYNKVKKYDLFPTVKQSNYKVKRIYLKKIFSYISIELSKIIYGKTIFLHDDTINFLSTLKLILKSKFRFSYLYFYEKRELSYKNTNLKILKYLSEKKHKDEFYNFIFKNIEFYMPENFLDLFKELATNKYLKKKRTIDMIISKRLCADNHFLKLFLLKNFSNIKIMAYQHGGLYGQEIDYFPEKYERNIADYFLSWGWSGHKVMPAPMHYPKNLSIYKKKITKKYGKFCLFVCLSLPRLSPYLAYSNRTEIYLKKSLVPSYKFLKKIVNRKKTYVRLPPYAMGWNEKLYLNRIKNVNFDNHEYEFEKMSFASDFVIINHFNTTALQSLSLNIPTFICCDKNFIKFNSTAKKHLKKLINANIFFYSFDDLSNFLDKINYDVETWWQNKKIQNIKNEFCKNYCLRSNNWEDEWIKKLVKTKK